MNQSNFSRSLVAFEEYMLADDSRDYPMDSFIRLRLSGALDRQRFSQAVTQCLKQHPLLNSKIVRKRFGHAWVPLETPFEISWFRSSDPGLYNASGFSNSKSFDLFQERGFRLFVIESDTKTEIVFQFHHCTSDGLSEFQFIEDILIEYTILLGTLPSDTPRRHYDLKKLNNRGRFGWSIWRYFRYYFQTSKTTWQFLVTKAKPLMKKEKIAHDASYPQVLFWELSTEETAKYQKYAKARNVTINDLLLSDIFSMIGAWQKTQHFDKTSGNVRLAVPINMRCALHEAMPVGNVVSMAFIDMKNAFLDDPDFILSETHRKMNWMKSNDQRFIFGLILKCGHLLTLGHLGFFTQQKRCRATTCVSNVGQIYDKSILPHNALGQLLIGNMTLEQIDGVPPIRSDTMISLSGMMYAQKLCVGLRYDAHFVSRLQAQEMLDLICSSLVKKLK